MNIKIVFGFLLAILIAVYVFWVVWTGNLMNHILQLVCITGGLLGWIVGIFITPYNTSEKVQFAEYGKAFGAAGAGFVAGRMDDILESKVIEAFLADTPNAFGSSLAFLVFLALGALSTFIGRRYIRTNQEELAEQREKALNELQESIGKVSNVLRFDT